MQHFVRENWPIGVAFVVAMYAIVTVQTNNAESKALLAFGIGIMLLILLYNLSRIAKGILEEQRRIRRLLESVADPTHEPN